MNQEFSVEHKDVPTHLEVRDEKDLNRTLTPLKAVHDAVIVDSSDLDIA
ncbi:MAG: hypothetical protein GX860_05615 [Alcaligenaceae bacterium]|nr:hypothetical protein [Alcaligenaceae bacterium]